MCTIKENDMNKNKSLLLALLLSSSMLLISCNNENKENNTKIEEETSKDTVNEKAKEEKKSKEEKKEKEKKEKLPEKSQPVTEFPWDEDEDFLKTQKENDTDVLIAGFCTVLEKSTPEERENINLAASTVTGSVVNPGEVFSQNETVGPYTAEKGYKEGSGYVGNTVVKSMGGGVCKVATTLYNTSIASDLDIVERHNHSMPVPYVPYGQDAAVAYGYKDLKFKNNTDDPMLIWAKLIDNRVYMGFYGKEEAPEIEWDHETLSETETTTEYRSNPELKEGEENVLVDGMDGKVVESVIRVKDKNGEEKIKELGKSTYLPMKNLIEKNE